MARLLLHFQTELKYLNLLEKLKIEYRHSWLSNKDKESVADHVFRLAMMVLRYADAIDRPIDLTYALKMALVHDLAEMYTGDIPVFDCQTPEAKEMKMQAEKEAMMRLKHLLNDKNGEELIHLWEAYESQTSYESRFVKALDKLEAFIQHIEAPLETWEQHEKEMLFQDKWLKNYCVFDSFLSNFADAVIEEGIKKLSEAGCDLNSIKQAAEKAL